MSFSDAKVSDKTTTTVTVKRRVELTLTDDELADLLKLWVQAKYPQFEGLSIHVDFNCIYHDGILKEAVIVGEKEETSTDE